MDWLRFFRRRVPEVREAVSPRPPEPVPCEAGPDPVGAALGWYGEEESFTVHGYTIPRPMLYASEGPPLESEASCIDMRLPVAPPLFEPKGALGYYPTYAGLDPYQRGNYLAWLASGRAAGLDDVGYVFLYYYGLERRLVVDQKDEESILREVGALLDRYGASRSFARYASGLMAYFLVANGSDGGPAERCVPLMEQDPARLCKDAFRGLLAWYATREAPLPAEIALALTERVLNPPKSVIIQRKTKEFRRRFVSLYEDMYGQGMTLASATRDRFYTYRPASPTLVEANPARHIPPLRIPDLLRRRGQFKPLLRIWSTCLEELRAPSRVGKGAREPAAPKPTSAVGVPVRVDHAVVARIRDETAEAARMIEEALPARDDGEPVAREPLAAGAGDHTCVEGCLDGLDPRYRPVLDALAVKGEWGSAEFDRLVREYGLMPGATLDALNTWADAVLGDFLVEEGEVYRIRRDLLEP